MNFWPFDYGHIEFAMAVDGSNRVLYDRRDNNG